MSINEISGNFVMMLWDVSLILFYSTVKIFELGH